MKHLINTALKTAGITRSQVTQYRFKDEYGTAAICKPRTNSLKCELSVVFDDPYYQVDHVWVNGLKEVVIEYSKAI